jgi:hypothetical protein
VNALRKDHIAWTRYQRTGQLPARVHSAGIDVPPTQKKTPSTFPAAAADGYLPWMRHLTPKQRRRARQPRTRHNECMRLRLHMPAQCAAWLAATEKEDGAQDARSAMYERLRTAHTEYQSLYQRARRAEQKQKQKQKQKKKTAAAKEEPAAAAGEAKAPPAPPVAAADSDSWMQRLAPEQQQRAAAARPGYAEYLRLRLDDRATRDARLGAAAGTTADDNAPSPRHALYERLRAAHNEYQSLYQRAHLLPPPQDGLTDGSPPPPPSPPHPAPEADASNSPSWTQLLTPEQQARVRAARAGYNEYMRLGLGDRAVRAAWPAQPSDDALGSRQARFEWMRAAHNEYHSLCNLAQRVLKDAPGRRPAAEQASLGAACKGYNEYLRLGLQERARREAWLAADDAQGSRKAVFERLRQAFNEYKRLYKLARRRRMKDRVTTLKAAGEEQVPLLTGQEAETPNNPDALSSPEAQKQKKSREPSAMKKTSEGAEGSGTSGMPALHYTLRVQGIS